MPDLDTLRDLLRRIEVATGPDNRLDQLLFAFARGWSFPLHGAAWMDFSRMREDGAYTSRIDAAVAFSAEVLPDRRIHFNLSTGGTLPSDASVSIVRTPDEASAHMMCAELDGGDGFESYVMEGTLRSAPTLPLAILAAALHAKIALIAEGGRADG